MFKWFLKSVFFLNAFLIITAISPSASAGNCLDGIYNIDLAWPLEGSMDDYENFLDFGVPWCSDQGYSWGSAYEVYNDCQTVNKHLGIDIKLKVEDSTNLSDGSDPNNLTKDQKIYASYDGKACSFELGGYWGGGVIIRHDGNGFTFFTIYIHVEPVDGLPSVYDDGGSNCENGKFISRRQPIGEPHNDHPADLLKIAEVYDLTNDKAHDRDHLHFAVRCDDVVDKCGGGSSSEIAVGNSGGKCVDPRSFFSGLELKKLFYDVPSDAWYKDYLYDLYKNNIVHGHPDGSFKPGDDITRAEFIKLVVLASGSECGDGVWNLCDDLPAGYMPEDHWAYEFVQTAYDLGWLDTIKTEFNPDTPIIRAEAVKILIAALDEGGAPNTSSPFADVTDPEIWYYNPVLMAYKLDIVSGYPKGENCEHGSAPNENYFCPGKNINRAEVTKVVAEAFLK